MASTAPKISSDLQKTPLWNLHVSLGGKMVPFAGYDMPVQYDGMGVMKEHIHTRTEAGLFDVSHMGQAILKGDSNPAAALETITPGDLTGLGKGKMRYTVLLNDDGGIVDDLMVTRWDDKTLLLVVNAACKEKDFAYIREKLGAAFTLEYLDDRALLALQGPAAEAVLATFMPEAATLNFMEATVFNRGYDVYLSRSGYTGEDGYEISLPAALAADFAKELLADERVKMIGLGARDSLRLEAGLCLYGHDIDDTTTPVEANLKWVIPKRRREEANFAGAKKIMPQFTGGTTRSRIGIKPEGPAPIREGTELVNDKGEKIGVVTSGGFGPTAGHPVAMGYVQSDYAKTGTAINAMLRGQARPCTVASLPFVPQNYKKN